MRQIVSLLALLVLLGSCSSSPQQNTAYLETEYPVVNNLEQVWLEIEGDSLSPDGLTLTLYNQGDVEVMAGSYYCIELLLDGVWCQVPYLPQEYDIGWTSEGYPAQPGGSYTFTPLDWSWLYGSLEPGSYRIVKDVSTGNGPTLQKYLLAVEFQL